MSYRKKLSRRDRPPEQQRASGFGSQHAGQKPRAGPERLEGAPEPEQRRDELSKKEE
jgi:hypothetical protein